MIDTIQDELLPALSSQDWRRWDTHAGVYGAWAGKIFEKVQGGVYRSDAIRKTVEAFRRLGCHGASQSSWGPIVVAAAQDIAHAEYLKQELLASDPTLRIQITLPRNESASIAKLDSIRSSEFHPMACMDHVEGI